MVARKAGFRRNSHRSMQTDCEHEVRPLTRGYRLSLVSNLTLEKSKQNISAPASSEHIAATTSLLCQWSDSKNSKSEIPQKLAMLLEHKYTQDGLTFDALKGLDRAKVDVLFAADLDSGFDAALALVTYWESGSAEPSGDNWYRYQRPWDNYDDEEDEEDAGEYEMGEVFDSTQTAEHFSDAEGNPLAYGSIGLWLHSAGTQ